MVKMSYILLQLLHMFATWMLNIATDYLSEAIAMSLYDFTHDSCHGELVNGDLNWRSHSNAGEVGWRGGTFMDLFWECNSKWKYHHNYDYPYVPTLINAWHHHCYSIRNIHVFSNWTVTVRNLQNYIWESCTPAQCWHYSSQAWGCRHFQLQLTIK